MVPMQVGIICFVISETALLTQEREFGTSKQLCCNWAYNHPLFTNHRTPRMGLNRSPEQGEACLAPTRV